MAKFYISIICFLLFTTILRAKAINREDGFIFNYTLTPKPTEKGIDLLVKVHFKSDSILMFTLPKDYYGVKEYQQYFTIQKGKGNPYIENTENQYQKKLLPDNNGNIYINYTLSLSRKEMERYSYSPNISPSHFHLTGSQWILPIGDLDRVNTYNIKITDYPENWNFYSSVSASPLNMTFKITYRKLIQSAFGGGNQSNTKFYIKEKPVSIFVQGTYNMENQDIVDAIKKVIVLQREWFNDYKQPFYTVSITNRLEHVAGISFPNLFACFIMPEVSKLKLMKLLSHEMFHMWLPHKLTIKTINDETNLRYSWFYEGFTDYFSRKILVEAGLMTEEEFIESINNDIFLIANNVSANDTHQQLLDRKANKNYSVEQNKLAYHRGSLMALKWETELEKSSSEKNLKQFILDLITSAKDDEGLIDFEYFIKKGNEYGINIKEDFENYIIKGQSIKIYDNSFGKLYKLKTMNVPSFNLGLNAVRQDSGKVILTDIEVGSNAYKSGLRNNMIYLSSKNDYPYSNAWVPNSLVTVVVKIDGAKRKFEFAPEGDNILIQKFVKR